jgi:hypothetical protein
MLVRTAQNNFNALNVGLPSTVSAAVRVGNVDSECNAFPANFTFCHLYTSDIFDNLTD